MLKKTTIVFLLVALIVGFTSAYAQESGGTADFVEAGVDISIYIDRYLNDAEFTAWYDQWYPDQAFYTSLDITEGEYQDIVDNLNEPAMCPAGTSMVDGVCVHPDMPKASAEDVYKAQGGGLQIGVAAAVGFGLAIGIVLVFWLPRRILVAIRNKRRSDKA